MRPCCTGMGASLVLQHCFHCCIGTCGCMALAWPNAKPFCYTMTSIRIWPHRCLVLSLFVFLAACCSCATAQRAHGCGLVEYHKGARHSRLPFTIPRGGDDLIDTVSDTVQDAFVDVAVGPWIKKHTVLIVKVLLVGVSSYSVAHPYTKVAVHSRQSFLPFL